MKTALCLFVMTLTAQAVISQEAKVNQVEERTREGVFATILQSDGPSQELGSNAGVYDWLIGSWSVRVVDYDGDKPVESRGEWHFSWVLEGRAIEDIFIVPSRDQRKPGMAKERNRYGVSLRYFDPSINAWHITWTNPVRAIQNQLTGRKVGDEIIQEARDEKGTLFMRWCFRDIRTDSFRWTGEESPDNGKTWRIGAEFFAVRMKSDR